MKKPLFSLKCSNHKHVSKPFKGLLKNTDIKKLYLYYMFKVIFATETIANGRGFFISKLKV